MLLALAAVVLTGCRGEEPPPPYSPVALPGTPAFLKARKQDEEMAIANKAAEAKFWQRLSRKSGGEATAPEPEPEPEPIKP